MAMTIRLLLVAALLFPLSTLAFDTWAFDKCAPLQHEYDNCKFARGHHTYVSYYNACMFSGQRDCMIYHENLERIEASCHREATIRNAHCKPR